MSNQWKLVPVEPTQSILDAMTTERKKGNGVLQMWFEAMAAAPVPPRGDAQPVAYEKPADYWYSYKGYCDYRDPSDLKSMLAHLEKLLDAIPEGPLYTRPVAGEAERLRDELKEWKTRASRHNICLHREIAQVRALRTQLAERDTLLREVINGKTRTQFEGDLMHRILMSLSATATPGGES